MKVKTNFKGKFVQRARMVITWLKTHCIFLNLFSPSRNNKQQNNHEIFRLECKFVMVSTAECEGKTTRLLKPHPEYRKICYQIQKKRLYYIKWVRLTVTLAPVKRLMRRMCLQNSGPWDSRSLSLLVTKSRAWIISCNSVWNDENY